MIFDQAFITAISLSVIPIMIMIALTAIAYMLSKLVNIKDFEMFAKMELYQIIFSMALLLLLIFGIQGLFSIITEIAGDDPFTISFEYLQDLIKNTISSMKSTFWGRLGLEFASKINIKLGIKDLPLAEHIPANAFISFPPSDVSILGKAVDKMFALLSPFYASLAVQQFILAIIKATMITLVLPVGIFLRIFPPTRNSGSFLIAVAIGFYVVFPATYVVHAATMEQINTNIQYSSMSVLESSLYETPDTYDTSFKGIWGKIFTIIGPGLYDLYLGIIMLPSVIMQGVFLPTISMAITISFITSTQKFLIQRFD
ncbi:MAG: hypothetical protein WC356_03125 [Candidatus Micrarchaeia archaeon]|jgi:hypothetical protein